MHAVIHMESPAPAALPDAAQPPLEAALPVIAAARPNVLVRFARWIGSGIEWLFGGLTLAVTLAVFAVVPVLNLLSLGYLLEVSGRVARTGKLRSAFIGFRKAAVFGRLVLGTWLMMLPVRFVSGMWRDAELIAPGSGPAAGWRVALIILTVLTAWHIVWACLRGGKLRHFFWPAPIKFIRWLRQGGQYESARNTVLDYLASLRLLHYLKLGGLGFVGAVAWLIVPVGILILGSLLPPGGGVLLGLLGGGLLMLVALHLPFLQAHYAVENRFAAMFELGAVRKLFRRAPIAFWFALLITLLFSLPLYLLKIEFPPQEIAWLPSLFFVVFIFPARVLTGWAVSRALRHEEPRHWFFRWTARLGAIPVVWFYALIVYLTQYLSWHGALSLLEQHAFLVPAPMLSM
jgi:hypothetical protein